MVKKKKYFKSVSLLIVCFVLLVIVVNGTVAWLTNKSGLLTSKFSYGNIEISIVDDSLENSEEGVNTYEIVPGTSIEKETIVTVKKESENCWLFIRINETENFDDFMSYSLEDGWNVLNGYNNVYYREVDKSVDEQSFNVIKNNEINVHSDITKEMFNSLTDDDYPSISIVAYAVQRNSKMDEIDTVDDAWLLLSNQNN